MQTLIKQGYTPVITPDLARVEVLEGIGFIPRARPGDRQIYTPRRHRPVPDRHGRDHPGRHAPRPDPRRTGAADASTSACRTASAPRPALPAGTRAACTASTSSPRSRCSPSALRTRARRSTWNCSRIEEEIFQGLGLPYHVIDTCTGDLGGPAYRKYDLEAWMPGRGQGGEYGEVTSTSNCTDYQARRLNIRYKAPGQKGTRFVHTLNGTAVACHPGHARHPGELPAGRRLGRGAGSAAADGRNGTHQATIDGVTFHPPPSSCSLRTSPFLWVRVVELVPIRRNEMIFSEMRKS